MGVGFSDNSWDGVGWENVGGIFKILKNAWDFPHANKSSRGQSGGNLWLSWDFEVKLHKTLVNNQ